MVAFFPSPFIQSLKCVGLEWIDEEDKDNDDEDDGEKNDDVDQID